MSEKEPKNELKETLKSDVLAVFKKFANKGITSPDSLDLDDLEVIEANKILDSWAAQEGARAKTEGREAEHRFNLMRNMIMIDVGFKDPEYLKDVLGWLDQDLENVDEESPQPLPNIAEEIRQAKTKIEKMIS